jgi:hypothetical protein
LEAVKFTVGKTSWGLTASMVFLLGNEPGRELQARAPETARVIEDGHSRPPEQLWINPSALCLVQPLSDWRLPSSGAWRLITPPAPPQPLVQSPTQTSLTRYIPGHSAPPRRGPESKNSNSGQSRDDSDDPAGVTLITAITTYLTAIVGVGIAAVLTICQVIDEGHPYIITADVILRVVGLSKRVWKSIGKLVPIRMSTFLRQRFDHLWARLPRRRKSLHTKPICSIVLRTGEACSGPEKCILAKPVTGCAAALAPSFNSREDQSQQPRKAA